MPINISPPNRATYARGVGAHIAQCMSMLNESNVMTTNTPVTTIAHFLARANSVPMGTVAELTKILKGKPLESLASAHVRTENNPLGVVASLYTVSKGIVEVLAYGQKSKLAGFGVASKRVGGGFTALVTLGVVSEAGELLIGVDPESKGKADYSAMMAVVVPFVAYLWASRCSIKAATAEAAKTEREAKKAAQAAEAAAVASLPEAPDMVAPGMTSLVDHVQIVLAMLQAGTIPTEQIELLRAALPKVARKAKATA